MHRSAASKLCTHLAAEEAWVARLDLHDPTRSIHSVDVGGEQHVELTHPHQLHALVLHQPVAAIEPPAGHQAFELEACVGVVLHVVSAPASARVKLFSVRLRAGMRAALERTCSWPQL